MTSRTLSLLAPAKLNLFLHITGRRADGYHNLQTLFQLLDFGDELNFSLRDDDEINLNPAIEGVAPEDNLIFKAAQLLRSHADDQGKQTPGVDIHLVKRLPMGGGIGGGSSDAATTLVALNHLWQTELSESTLKSLGAKLGADVPVFVGGQTAWAEGIGEELQAIELEEKWYCVLAPNCHISTSVVFSNKGLTRDTSDIKVAAFLEQGGRNDCQALVCDLYPEVKNAIDWLSQFAPAQMTGTGACVFSAFTSKAKAEKIFKQRPKNFGGFIAKGINESPVRTFL